MNNGGCAFGKVTRTKVENTELALLEIKASIGDLRNHYSQRLPVWATSVLTFSGIIIGVLASLVFK